MFKVIMGLWVNYLVRRRRDEEENERWNKKKKKRFVWLVLVCQRDLQHSHTWSHFFPLPHLFTLFTLFVETTQKVDIAVLWWLGKVILVFQHPHDFCLGRAWILWHGDLHVALDKLVPCCKVNIFQNTGEEKEENRGDNTCGLPCLEGRSILSELLLELKWAPAATHGSLQWVWVAANDSVAAVTQNTNKIGSEQINGKQNKN